MMNALELLRCAEINFGNLTKMNPQIAQHPMFQIAMSQLKEAIQKLEEKEAHNVAV